jgi:hypothetical protein
VNGIENIWKVRKRGNRQDILRTEWTKDHI